MELTTEQDEYIKSCFDDLDTDKSGNLDVSETTNFLRMIGLNPTEEEVVKCVSDMNTDDDSTTLSYEEFKNMVVPLIKQGLETMESEFREAFKEVDTDGSGKLDPNEFRNLVTQKGDNRMTDEEVDDLLNDVDINHDGSIDSEVTMTEHESRQGPDEVIYELGGCGWFQIRLAILVHLMNTVIVWSLHSTIFVTAAPTWWCTDGLNTTDKSDDALKETCLIQNNTECSSFAFSKDMHTIVDEWNLICDKAWIPSGISSLQIVFQLLGNFVSGHIADAVGRKIPIFMTLIVLIAFNLLAFFSVSWLMYAIIRAVIGAGTALFLTVRYNYMSEFALSRWRPWLIGIPTWSLEACLLVPVLWISKDWRVTHLAIAIVGVPFVATWWFLPESFRWYYARDRIVDAEQVVTKMSTMNHRPIPDMTYMKQMVMASVEETKRDKKYTALDLFRRRFLIKITLILSVCWFALGMISYGISFEIPHLSGSIYLNILLFAFFEIPPRLIQPWLLNRFGRRPLCICAYLITGIAAFIVGIVQYVEIGNRDELTKWFALVANIGTASIWHFVQTATVETYPTVVRNIAYGFCSVFARIGASLGPQLAFLEDSIAGILYFSCGTVATVCIICLIWLPETKDTNLCDKLHEELTPEQTHEQVQEPRSPRII